MEIAPSMRSVKRAFTFGVTPNFTCEKIYIGKVDSGPIVNNVITNSSNERVKANSAPAMTPGRIIGKVDVEEILGSIFQDFCIGK